MATDQFFPPEATEPHVFDFGDDFDPSASGDSDFPVLPEGVYRCKVEKLVHKTSKGGNLMYEWTFSIVAPDVVGDPRDPGRGLTASGRFVWEYCVVDPDGNPDATRFGKLRMGKILHALGYTVKGLVQLTDLSEVAGCHIGIHLGIDPKDSTRNKAQDYYAVSEAFVPPDPEAPQPGPTPPQAPTR